MARLARAFATAAFLALLVAGCGATGFPPPATAPDTGELPDAGNPPPPPPPPGGATDRVSVASDGTLADGDSAGVALSANGLVVAFASVAGNLVAGDTNGVWDVFVHDRAAGRTERVSLASDGAEGDGDSRDPAMSADGRFVAFVSAASNLAAGGSRDRDDVYVHDRLTRTTERVSVAAGGGPADGSSWSPRISADGRFAAFTSAATNLVADGGGHGAFLYDRVTGVTERLPGDGAFTISGDARYVVAVEGGFDVVLLDRATGATRALDLGAAGGPNGDVLLGGLSADGGVLTFASLANNLVPGTDGWGAGWNVFAYELASGSTELVSVTPDGRPGNDFSFDPIPSADGRAVLFASLASDLVSPHEHVGWSLFLRDRDRGTTLRLPVSTGPTSLYEFGYALSGDGEHAGLTYWASFDADGYAAGVEGMAPHPSDAREVFVHTFAH